MNTLNKVKQWIYLPLFALLFLPIFLTANELSYNVKFEGLDDPAALQSLMAISQLVSQKKRPPASLNALRYRAETDKIELLKVLHAHGYYEATVTMRLEEVFNHIQVLVTIQPGPLYSISEYVITPELPTPCASISLEVIGITLGKGVEATKILEAELKILDVLSDCGYPLAQIIQREIIADGESKTVRISIHIDHGPFTRFGPLTISGEESVQKRLIEQKITWKEGDLYEDRRIEKTQEALLNTGLFSAVLVTHDQTLNAQGRLPMRVEVTESKHRSVHIGASYQTVFGPGGTFGWEHRNVGGLGRTFTLRGDVTRISHSGIANYQIPDFHRLYQDLVLQAQAMHESITAYSMRSYNALGRFERKFGERFRASIGIKVEEMLVRDSVNNGNFPLLESPIYFRWSSADNLLDPKTGSTWQYIAIPTCNFRNHVKPFLYQEVIQSVYFPVKSNGKFVLAQKITLGSIFSHKLNDVPVPKRFLGGSEEDLRGYKYQTVSPLADHHQPIGGRSAIYYSLEMRWRISTKLGLVPFFDSGNVQLSRLPTFKGKWRRSVGVGMRYFSFLGPLRFDIGFPLDRREGLDSKYRLLVSIGQMF